MEVTIGRTSNGREVRFSNELGLFSVQPPNDNYWVDGKDLMEVIAKAGWQMQRGPDPANNGLYLVPTQAEDEPGRAAYEEAVKVHARHLYDRILKECLEAWEAAYDMIEEGSDVEEAADHIISAAYQAFPEAMPERDGISEDTTGGLDDQLFEMVCEGLARG